MYHPNKTEKIRATFDCKAEFNGTLLNKNLLSGPGPTNQIAGVTMKFCQEPVVVMGNIEAMFHQVLVPKKDRSLLKFLCWRDHDISGKAADFEMGVHVFGSASSLSCCNYVLKWTACDNETKYIPDVANTLKKNFYVDDLLKSLKDIEAAARLVHDVINMCADGGICLTKFVSNKFEVLEQIPEKDSRSGLKSADLSNGADLPTEKALGVNWNIESDKLGFKVKLEGKPQTRQGMLSTVSKIYDPYGLAAQFSLRSKRILQ